MKVWNGSSALSARPAGVALPEPGPAGRTLVLAFGSPEGEGLEEAVGHVVATYPDAVVVGCSTSGEISGTAVHDDSLAISVASFDATEVRKSVVEVEDPAHSAEAGGALGRALAGPGLRAVFVLSDGLGVNGSELVRGLNGALPDGVVVTGGLAGDGTRFEKTWVLADGVMRSKVVVGVGLYGDRLQVGHGSKGGWDAFGPERIITRSAGNVLFELDGKPALDLYKQYLGAKAAELPSSGLLFPLALRDPNDREKVLVRTLLAVDEEARSMTFAGDLPEGGTVQLMKADFDRLVDGARDAAAATGFGAASAAPGSHALAVAVSCVGRRLVLGERTEEELEAVRRTLPEVQHIAGFYSYGELSPAAGSASCDLHNQTMTLTVFSEAAEDLPARVVAAKPAPTDDFAGEPLFQLPDEAGTPTVLQRRHTPPTTAKPVLPEPEPPTASGQDFGFDFGFDAFDGTGSMEPAAPPPAREEPRKPAAETPRPAAAAPRKRTTLKRVHQPRANLLTDIRRGGEYQILTLAGRMSEGFEGAELGRKLVGKVVVDLHGVERVTSFGVRGWLDMLREMDVDALYFVRCSEAIVNQLGMIRNFCGPGKVVSFFAPYACPACGLEFNALYDAIGDRKAIDAHNPFDVECPACSRAGVFDDDPWSYFAMNAELAESVDPALAEALTRLTPMGDASDPVQKEIEGQETVIRINARLDENLRLRRVLDGLEGRVVFDMTGVQGSSPAGVRGFASALQRLDPGISEVVLAGCPEALLELLMREPLQARMRIASVMVTGICPDNRTSRQVFVDLEAHADEILAGQTPRLRCEWCTSPVDIQSVLPLLARCLSRDTAGHTVSPDPVPVEVDAAPVAPAPVLPPPPAPSVSPWTVMLGGIAGAALLSTGVLATLLAVTAFAPDGPPPTAEPVAAVLQPPTPAPAQQLGWEGGASLPPGWTEQPFALTATEAAVVGSGSGATVEEAAEAARIAAHTALVERL
ncbi:MAG: FIST C-terminal domain-containing protein, partial [Myxococcales bacterium]|nr:FIST C-terminal domain-containing protein [Myxococcales bacterium]